MTTTDIHIEIDNDYLYLEKDGKEYKFALKDLSNRLFEATLADKINFIVSPSGYGIHWPTLDEDLSIQAMIKTLN